MFENWELGGRVAGGPLNNVWRGSFGDPLMLQLSHWLPGRPQSRDPRIADSPCIPHSGCFKGFLQEEVLIG